ncbi:MAG TPA: hypothetical protein VG326_16840 [Tepidisphaeraceae bacterium]|jgi:hypothetical protein|nr:hypothetical protein [Tepidisphaeraceae bacterium]
MPEPKNAPLFFLMALLLTLLIRIDKAKADDDDNPKTSATTETDPNASRFGALGLLEKRSRYYSDWFPEPLRVEDTTVNNELRLDYQHEEAKGVANNQGSIEVQKSAGIMTFEICVPYVSDATHGFDANVADRVQTTGVGNVELGARLPIVQYVTQGGFYDNTIGVILEVGIPTNSHVSKNTEIAPGIFDDLRLGEHFSLQSLVSFSTLLGSAPDEGRQSMEYGVAFGYSIEDEDLPLPWVEQTIPLFELVGETGLDGDRSGHNALTATAGFRLEMKRIHDVQPQLGFGYIFPVDKGGREDLRWGIIVSLSLEF